MIVDFKYAGQSAIVQGLETARMALAANAARDAAFFKGTLARPLVLREALGALHDVVTSDLKYRPRDRFAFRAWLDREDARFLGRLAVKTEQKRVRLEQLEARRATLDDAQALRFAPFFAARKSYFDFAYTHGYELNYVLDPIITVHPDELFFEAFSKDESSYARVGARYDLFERIHAFECGTTNVDFSSRLAGELDRIRSYKRTDLDLGPTGFGVSVADGAMHHEKKVDVPDSWVNGFLQVQSVMTMGLTRVRLATPDVFSIVRFLARRRAHRSPRALRYELVPGKPVRVVLEPWEHVMELSPGSSYDGDKPKTVRTWGRDRLRVLARVLPHAQHVDVYLAGLGLPTVYVADLGEVSFTLALSGWTDNDWTGGAKFDLLTRRLDGDAGELLLVYDALKKVRHGTDTEIAAAVKLGVERTRSALSHLCQIGRAMYDLSTRHYRHRDLFASPMTMKDALAAVAPAATPKAQAATAIFGADDVRIIARRPFSGGFKLSGSAKGESGGRVRPLITVNHAGEIVEGTCTCSFHKSHGLTKGPCEHLLALRLAHMSRLDLEDQKGGATGNEA